MGEAFKIASCIVVSRYSGLNVAQMGEVRRRMRVAGATFKVTKNRLTKLALKDTGFEPLADFLVGHTAIAYGRDPVAVAKTAVDYAKANDKFVVVGGAMAGRALDADGVRLLASLPSLEQLRGKLAGLMQAPAVKLAMLLQAPAAQLARVVHARAQKDEAA